MHASIQDWSNSLVDSLARPFVFFLVVEKSCMSLTTLLAFVVVVVVVSLKLDFQFLTA